jgi:hypothetical protein
MLSPLTPASLNRSSPARCGCEPAPGEATVRQHEGRPLEGAQVDADRLGAQRRIAAGAQHVAERREQRAPQHGDAEAAQRESQIVVDRLIGEPGGGPDADQPIAARRELVPLEDDRP